MGELGSVVSPGDCKSLVSYYEGSIPSSPTQGVNNEKGRQNFSSW